MGCRQRSLDKGLVNMFGGVYQGKRILITGHTGFKGSWLTLWLKQLGAETAGYALPPATTPNHFGLIDPEMQSFLNDVRDYDALVKCFTAFRPEAVFHLAAQPLVRESYLSPRETFAANVQGTVNVLEACRNCAAVQAVIVISSDKCYENREWVWGYRETDPLGGYDPYSASKGAAELAANSYRNAFFNPADFGRKHHTLLASCRAGNVVGGGDWASDRLVPDIMRAAAAGIPVKLRHPEATRPWQHVLEPLSGYLAVGQQLLAGNSDFSGAWNFGPAADAAVTVREVTEMIRRHWPEMRCEFCAGDQPHEAGLLKLDCSKARVLLKWHGIWDGAATFERTVNWYRNYYEHKLISSRDDLQQYIAAASAKGMAWTR
ncbi:MAG: CDP-glucose 4,6-dehydratase [Victivallaceae bacterium]|nr:CDP-glucose 4,6-dehydratase [Victivallaceae bacterium]